VSSLTLAELRYGADLRRSRKLHHLIDTFVDCARAPRRSHRDSRYAHCGACPGLGVTESGRDTVVVRTAKLAP
jgi:hypothetical protein